MREAARHELTFEDGAVSYLEWEWPREAPLLLFLHANGFNVDFCYRLLSKATGRPIMHKKTNHAPKSGVYACLSGGQATRQPVNSPTR